MSRLLLQMSLVFVLASCSNLDETTITDADDNAIVVSDAWICDMKSFEEDMWYYETHVFYYSFADSLSV